MKKLVSVLMIVAVLALVGCGGASNTDGPAATLEGYLTAVKEFKTDEMAKYAADGADASSQLASVSGEAGEAGVEMAKALFSSIDYKIGSESINGDAATVDVDITTVPYVTVITNASAQLQQLSIAGDEPTQEDIQKIVDIINEEAKKVDKVTKSVTVNLVKEDDSWKISDDNMNLGLAMLGQ